MTDDKKKDDKDRKKVSDEELEDVAGGGMGLDRLGTQKSGKPKKNGDSKAIDHNSTRSNRG